MGEHPLELVASPASDPGLDVVGVTRAAPAELQSVPPVPGLPIGYLSAGDETDGLTGPILADVLRRSGLGFDRLAGNASVAELKEWVGNSGARVVCIGGFAPHAVVRARRLYRRLRSAVPDVRVLVTLWGTEDARPESLERLEVVAPDRVATTMAEALEALRALTAERAPGRGATPDEA